MDHCRGFVRGLKIGAMSAPLMGILSIMILLKFKSHAVDSEVGWDVPIAETLFWLPVSASIRALAGAIAGARRAFQSIAPNPDGLPAAVDRRADHRDLLALLACSPCGGEMVV
jgi:hypothetical protein